MAFIYEEERKFDFNNEKEKFLVGPGQYLPLTEKKVYKENIAPFESSCPKLHNKINKNPGPGAYHIDVSAKAYSKIRDNEKIMQIENIGSILTDQTLTTKDNAGVTEIKQARARVRKNYERLGFSIKEKRFKDDSLLSFLGPGCYLDQDPKNEHRVLSARCQEMKNKVVKLQPGQIKSHHDNIPSIPQKETYGFAINRQNNTLIKKGNPEDFKYFSGIKGDTVGPGSYEVDFPEQWHKSMTNWSKSKGAQAKKKNDKTGDIINELNPKNDYSNYTKENLNNENDIEERQQLASLSKFSLKQLMKRDMDNRAKKKVSIDKHHKANNYPGPGYYFDVQLHSEFTPSHPYDDKNICFGSKKARLCEEGLIKRDNNPLGPGSYFTHNKKRQRLTKGSIYEKPIGKKVPFASNTDRFSASTQSSLSLPGPGTYSSESSIASNHFSKTSTAFYAHQQRFIESKNELERIKQIPGPGSYLDAFSNTGSSNTVEFNGRFIDSRKAQEFRRKRAQTASKPTIVKYQSGASVGDYNPGYAMTIEYKNIKKTIGRKREVAFNSSCSYKFTQTAKQDVGPGSYFIDSFTDINQKQIPFNHSISRYTVPKQSKSKADTKQTIGPGLYSFDELYSWHKKSFNIKYL